MAGLLADQGQDDQAQLAVVEHPPAAAASMDVLRPVAAEAVPRLAAANRSPAWSWPWP